MTLAAAPEREPLAPPTPHPAVDRRSRRAWLTAAGLSALVLAATALRVEGIETWYWIDESLSIGLASHDLLDIPGLLLRDGSPPLWYLLLHGWMALFGTSVVATHALSVVFAVLTVPVAWLVARRLFGDRAAWLTGALAAFSPFVTYFANETRMYSLVVVLGLVAAGSFVRAFVDGDRRAEWWFGGSLLALLYTHNWGIYTTVACALALVPVTLSSPERRATLRRAVVVLAVVGVGYLPWVPSLLSQIDNTGAPWSYTPSFRDVVRELAALFRDERVLAVIVLGVGVGLSTLGRRWRSRDSLAAIVLGLVAAVPVLIGWAVAHVEPSWATRYLAVVVGPLLLLAGMGLARANGVGIAAVAIAAVLVIQPVTRLGGRPQPREAKSNARSLAAAMAPRLDPGDVIIVAQPEAVPLLRGELGPGFTYADPMGAVADPTLMDWRDAEQRLRASSEADLAPLLDSTQVGQRVLLVFAANARSRTDTTWIDLFHKAGRRTSRAVRADDRFVLIERHRGKPAYATFDAALYERVPD